MLRATYTLEYAVDARARPLPAIVDESFTTRDSASPALYFRVGGIVVACHFFITTEMELGLSPREVNSQAAFGELLGLLRLIGDTLGGAVIMSYESDKQYPFITYDPNKREFQYHRALAWPACQKRGAGTLEG